MATPPPAVPPPRHVPGAGPPWQLVRDDFARLRTVFVYARPEEWSAVAEDERRLPLLLGHEAARWRRLPDTAVRRQFVASRILVKHTAGALLGVPPHAIALDNTRTGAPFLPQSPWLRISLSHTDGLVLAGFSAAGPVGVDVERSDRPLVALGLPDEFCTPDELAFLRGLPPHRRNACAVRLWTLKEACTKAVGRGMRLPFTGFGFDLSTARPRLRPPLVPHELRAHPWQFSTRTLCRPGYTASFALQGTYGGQV
ncbi:4'-phosphopantetheinyl transferase superfamily protein [Streptomyces coacervatus]|nr:4'-phosphopantetheinyl transferase superfamily protein [Streptomyces coacervatus]MDF2266802.1 4'-phosphopantetheinyl transferase superfamily protein [Streptomyces coacervatus]